MSALTRVKLGETGIGTARSVDATTAAQKKGCSRCKLLEEANQKIAEQIRHIVSVAGGFLFYSGFILHSDRESDAMKGLIYEALVSWPIVAATTFAMMEDKLHPSLSETPLGQASLQKRTAKKVGIAATVLYSLLCIPLFLKNHIENVLLAAVVCEFGSRSRSVVNMIALSGLSAGALSVLCMQMKEKMYPSSFFAKASGAMNKMDGEHHALEETKKECSQCKLLDETNQKRVEYIRIAKKVGIIASVLSSPIFIANFARDAYRTYLMISSQRMH